MSDCLNDLCLGELLSVFYRKYQSYMNDEMKAYGINFSEVAFLLKIPDDRAIIQKDIADILHYDYAIVTRSMQKLEDKGFVTREKSSEDKRAVLVSLTEEGSRLKAIGIKARRRWKDSVMSIISEQEKDEMFSKIKDLVENALVVNE